MTQKIEISPIEYFDENGNTQISGYLVTDENGNTAEQQVNADNWGDVVNNETTMSDEDVTDLVVAFEKEKNPF